MPYENSLRNFRLLKGLTQQQLADLSSVSIRTIQRIEKNQHLGSPYTISTLSKALGIEVSDWLSDKEDKNTIQNDLKLAKLMNLGTLAVLFVPLGNLITPFLIFRKNKANYHTLRESKSILNFQILWSVVTLFFMITIPMILVFIIENLNGFRIPAYVVVYVILALINVLISLWVAISLGKNRNPLRFIPELI